MRGEHRDAIMRDLLGYDDQAVTDLAKAGAFGDRPAAPEPA